MLNQSKATLPPWPWLRAEQDDPVHCRLAFSRTWPCARVRAVFEELEEEGEEDYIFEIVV